MDKNELLSGAAEDNADKRISQGTAEAAGAGDSREEAATDLGKFQSVGALLTAYKSLEAEFTRRSQRLKELEEGNKTRTKAAPSPESGTDGGAEIAVTESGGKAAEVTPAGNINMLGESVKNAVIEEYLRTVASGKSVPLIVGGVSSAAPKQAPKTVKEAGALVKTFLKN